MPSVTYVQTMGVSISMTIIATMALALRFIAKSKGKVVLRVEDWLIILAYLTFIAYIGVVLQALTEAGGTLDFMELNLPIGLPKLDAIFYWSYYAEALFMFSITFAKFSVLFLFRTIFSTEGFRKKSNVLLVLCGVWFLVCLFCNIFQCKPVEAAWKLELQLQGQAVCFGWGDFIVGLEASNIFLDLCILALPLATLSKMKLSAARKIVIGFIFGLVLLVCVVGIVRIYYLHGATLANPAALSKGINWSTVELSVAILCACLPCCGPILPIDKISGKISKIYGTSSKKSSNKYPSYQKFSSGSSMPANSVTHASAHREDPTHDTYPLNAIHVEHNFSVKS